MSARGRAFLLKFRSDEELPTYLTAAGLRVSSETISEGAVTITAIGIFLGSTAEALARRIVLSGQPHDCELSFEGGDKLRAGLRIRRLDYVGDFNGERNYTLQLDSAGPVDQVPA